MNAALFHTLVLSLLLTLLLELPAAVLMQVRGRKNYLLFLLANLITNPAVVLLNLTLRTFTMLSLFTIQLPLELAAFAVEGFLYRQYGGAIRHPWLLSLTANGISYGTGLIIHFIVLGGGI